MLACSQTQSRSASLAMFCLSERAVMRVNTVTNLGVASVLAHADVQIFVVSATQSEANSLG